MKFAASTVLIPIAAAIVPAAANASVTITISQVGPDVVATGSGSLDLTGLTPEGNGWNTAEAIWASLGYLGIGDHSDDVAGYSGLSGPAAFGTGGESLSSTSSGTTFDINGSGFASPFVFVPDGYTSGSPISDTATWLGQTFASLGLAQGHYVFTAPDDTIVVNIGSVPGPVPEPSTWATMLLGFAIVGWAMRRMSRAAEAYHLP